MYQLKLAALILSCSMSMTMLFPSTPSAPAQPAGSATKSPAASAYANTKLTYKIIDAHGYGKRFIVRADEKLTAFLELEAEVRNHQGTLGTEEHDTDNFRESGLFRVAQAQ